MTEQTTTPPVETAATPAPVAETPAASDFDNGMAEFFGFEDAADATDFFADGPVNDPAPQPSVGTEGVEGVGETPVTPTPETPATVTTETTAPAETPQPAAKPAQTTPVTEPSPEDKLKAASEAAELERLRKENQALRTAKATEETGEPKPATSAVAQPQDEVPVHKVQLPPQVLEAVMSEDPAQAGEALNAVVNGVLNTVEQMLARDRKTSKEILLGEVKAMLGNEKKETETKSQAAQQAEQYYAAFPTHNNPLLENIIGRINSEMATTMPGVSWGPDWIAALGARVNAEMDKLGVSLAAQDAAASTPVSAAPAPSAKPASFISKDSPRTATPTGEAQLSDQIDELFGGGFSGF